MLPCSFTANKRSADFCQSEFQLEEMMGVLPNKIFFKNINSLILIFFDGCWGERERGGRRIWNRQERKLKVGESELDVCEV